MAKKNNTTVNNKNNQENKMEDVQKIQQVNDLIKEIQSNYQDLMDGEQKTDNASREIGKRLLRIEREELYKIAKDKDGKAITTMSKFIKVNFTFSSQNGVMLKQSARVQEILGLDDTVSFRLLRSLNRYTAKPEAMKTIWKNATKDTNKPNKKQLDSAIAEWEKDNPEYAYHTGKKENSLDDVLNNKDLTLKEIGSALTKLDLTNISKETADNLIEKIKELLNQNHEEIKAA